MNSVAPEGELAEAVDFVQRLCENGVDGVAVFDPELQFRYWGAALEAMAGVPRAAALRRSLYDVDPAARDTGVDLAFRRVLDGAAVNAPALFFPTPRGMIAEGYEVLCFPVHGPRTGRVVAGAAVARSRLDHTELQLQVRELDLRFRRMADSSPVLLWMAGLDGRCDFFNQTWLDFTGRTMEQEVGYGWAEGVHPEDFERCVTFYMREFAARRAFEMEYRLLRRDGAFRWILDRGAPRFLANGDFAGYIGSCVDITDRRMAEDDARRNATRYARTAAELEKFAYVAAHDLRAPVRALDHLMAWLEDDLGDAATEPVRARLGLMRRRVERMDRLLRSLLDYARSAGDTLRPTRVDLGAMVADLFELLRATYPGFELVTEGRLPVVETAADAMERVLQNLLENALKHHDRATGRVTVAAVTAGDYHEVSVADDGPGIPEALHEKAFELFQTLRRRDEHESTGMGLALARRVVESVGGRLWVESPTRDGRGATFRFTWPVQLPRSAG